MLYSELKRVREEADSLRRDVASQYVLQRAAQTELAQEKQRRAEESEVLAALQNSP